jgi:hypothetical protein
LSFVPVVPVALQRDEIGLKSVLELDQNRKVLVGPIQPIDLEYTRQHPLPDPSQLKDIMVEETL